MLQKLDTFLMKISKKGKNKANAILVQFTTSNRHCSWCCWSDAGLFMVLHVHLNVVEHHWLELMMRRQRR